LSIDYSKAPQYHFEIGKEIAALRKKGVLVVGSGNMVHNLRMVNFANFDGPGYDWAVEINEKFKAFIQSGDNNRLIRYDLLGTAARLAIPTPEHYLPLLFIMGVRDKSEKTSFFNDKAIAGSLTMTSVKIG
jgi:4,5-DOPA dioxygenase extradiol